MPDQTPANGPEQPPAPPETLRVPWGGRNVAVKTVLYLAVIGMLGVIVHQMGEWNEAALLIVVAGLFFFHLLYRMHSVLRRGGDCMVLGPERLEVNCWDAPFSLPWDALYGTEHVAVGNMQRKDSIRLLMREDRLEPPLTDKNAKPFPREPGTRYVRLDCTYIGLDCAVLKAELDRRITAAGGKGDVGIQD